MIYEFPEQTDPIRQGDFSMFSGIGGFRVWIP